MDRYHEAVADTELLALREDIALLDARLADLMGRVDSGEAGALWNALGAAWQAVQDAHHNNDPFELTTAIHAMSALIKRGQGDYAAWDEVVSLIERRRKLVESERKRLVEMQQMVTSEQVMVLVAALADSVRQHVSDPDARAAISADLIRLVSSQPR